MPRPAQDDVIAYSFRTVTFKKIGATDDYSYDLLDIVPKKGDGSDWAMMPMGDYLGGQLKVRTIDAQGQFGDLISYFSIGNQGWLKNGSTKVVRGEIKLKKGDGLYVEYSKAADCKLQCSGEVELMDTTFLVARPEQDNVTAFSFSGNITPVAIDLLDIVPKKGDGSDWAPMPMGDYLGGQLKVRTIDAEGQFGDLISYTSLGNMGWMKNGSTPIVRGEVPLAPGTALYVQYSKAADCRLSMPNPMATK